MAVKPLNPTYKEPIKRQRGPRAKVSVTSSDPFDGLTPDQRAQEQRYTILATTVEQQIREAITARDNSGIEWLWQEDNDQYNGTDEGSYNRLKDQNQALRSNYGQATNRGDNRSRVFVPITKPKTDIGVARVSEMLLPNDDKPWDIEPESMPELEEAIKDPKNAGTATLGDGTQVPAAAVAQMHLDMVKGKCEAESAWIEERLSAGSVYAELRQVIRDAGRIGTGVIKGPYPVQRKTQKWLMKAQGKPAVPVTVTGNKVQPTPTQQGVTAFLKTITTIEPTSKCIRAEDCYPDPSCGDNIHDGAFFVERDFITGKSLKALAFLPGYDAQCIVDALKEGPMPFARRRDTTYRRMVGDSMSDSKLFELYYYYGDASPEDLELLMMRGNGYEPDRTPEPTDGEEDDDSPLKGVLSKEDRIYLQTVPVLLTMLNGRPIKAALNPQEVGGFPYDFFPWEPVKGQPWGRSIPRKMGVAQRMLNAAVRALLENAGLSAGPQIVTANGAITPWNGKHEVRGHKGWYFTPNDSGIDDVRKAFMVVDVPSTQEQLSAIIQFALDMADQLTNLPMLMQGDQQAGTSPETLGGMKMLFNNAMSPLRTIAKLFDDKLISPHLGRYHDWAMEKGPDNIKGGDSRVVARGSTALIQREEGREFLTQLFPMKDDPNLRIDPSKMLIEMGRANGYDISNIQYSDADWQKLQAQKAQQQAPEAPAVTVAKINAQVKEAQIKSDEGLAERANALELQIKQQQFNTEEAIAEIDKQIAEMQLSGKSGENLMNIKAMLAAKAMDNRIKVDDMNLKVAPNNPSHTGIVGAGSTGPATPLQAVTPGGK